MIDYKYLNADEYIKNKYDGYDVIISHYGDLVINDDYTVSGNIPTKIMLPPLFDDEQIKKTL
jgi:hypothetical protein